MPGPLSGLIPAPHTPFLPDGGLNLEAVPLQAALLRESGLDSVFIGGTTGEWASMSSDERRGLAEAWVAADGGSFRVAVHVGGNCRAEAVALASHARQVGAKAVAAIFPSYYRPETIRDFVEFCVPIAAAAAPLPFYFYDFPAMTGVRFPMSDCLREGKLRIPTLRGLKFSNNDWLEFQECIRLDGGAFDALLGADECYLAGLSMGFAGTIGNTYNFAAPVYHRIREAFQKGDFEAARREQGHSIDLVKALAAFGFLAASKAAMAMVGVDCGPVRLPVRELTRDQKLALWERLSPLDVFPRPLRKPE
ncbi:dihydrodipicolinate synthase family protein [Paludisphaera soli]|uniref:dihydrodipicolinate synthase family protein n=1 Tax=Paludisphaera soli TaxID=2712865 RepID=UPI0013EAA185|nr:dihydrodipicolinate synthase family protein [Paludisphaera soli]